MSWTWHDWWLTTQCHVPRWCCALTTAILIKFPGFAWGDYILVPLWLNPQTWGLLYNIYIYTFIFHGFLWSLMHIPRFVEASLARGMWALATSPLITPLLSPKPVTSWFPSLRRHFLRSGAPCPANFIRDHISSGHGLRRRNEIELATIKSIFSSS